MTRRNFLGLSALLAGGAALPKLARGSATPPALPPMPQRGAGIEADLIVVNGRVLTRNPAT